MKKIHIVICFLLAVLVLPISVSALEINLGTDRAREAADAAGYDPATGQTTLAATLGSVVRLALSLLGVIFMMLIIYAGFLWMTARGNEQQIEKAQEIIRAAIIGLIITVGAYSITSFIVPRVIQRAGGTSDGP